MEEGGVSTTLPPKSILFHLIPISWPHIFQVKESKTDADQPNTKRNHANDPSEVPIEPIIRARAKKIKEALN
jgi:hypothetical protein